MAYPHKVLKKKKKDGWMGAGHFDDMLSMLFISLPKGMSCITYLWFSCLFIKIYGNHFDQFSAVWLE